MEALISKLTTRHLELIRFTAWSGFDTGWVHYGTGAYRRRSTRGHPAGKMVNKEIPNPVAYNLLMMLTGRDYGYNRNEWLNWLKSGVEDSYKK